MAAVIQFPMEDYGVNSEFKESDSQESQKVSGYSAPLDIQPLVSRVAGLSFIIAFLINDPMKVLLMRKFWSRL